MKTKVTGYLTQKHGFYYVVLNLPTDEKGKRNRKTLSTGWCCTIKVDIENSKGQYIEKDKQEATKDGSESTKIQHGI